LPFFIAPTLVDAAFDFPASAAWRLWWPLFALAVVAVLLSYAAARRSRLAQAKHRLGRVAIFRPRERLEELRAEQRVGAHALPVFQEELDFKEVALSDDDERRIEEN
jgi:hypothetical protein